MAITGNKGGSHRPHTPTESPDSLHSTAKAKILLALGEGEFAGELDGTRIYLDGTPLNNVDGTANFTGVSWDYRPGTPSQDYIQGMPNVENEITVNRELKSNTPWVQAINNTQLSAVRLRFSWPALQRQRDNGDVNGTRIEYAIEIATDGGAYHRVFNTAVEGKTTTRYQRSYRINLPEAKTGWQLRVCRLTPNSTHQRLADRMHIDALAEIIDAKLRYPNTALLYVEFDASQFQQIPVIACEPKMRIIRVPTTYDPVIRTYSGTWNGTFKWAYSNNPAWVFYDILLAECFGLGHRLTAAQVDKWELYRIAQYCDQLIPDGKGGKGTEPRFLCDVYIQSQAEAFTVLRDLAAIFRGMTYWANNQLCALADMPRDRDYLYTRANVIDGRFTYASTSAKSRYSTALVSWSDPTNGYQDTIEAISDDALVRRYGIHPLSTTAIGCIRQTEAHRRGRWALLTNAKDRLISFAVGLEGAIPLPGHIIAVADEMLSGRKSGGRIRQAAGCDITLDRLAEVKPGDRLLVNLPSGIAQARTVQAVNGQIIRVTVPYTEPPHPEAIWSVEADDLALQHYRVTRIEDNNDNTYRINAVQHDPDKYERIDSGTRLDERPISVIPLTLQPPPTQLKLTSQTVIAQGLAVTTVQVSWQAATGAIAYDAQWRRDNGNWTPLLRVLTCGFDVPNSYAGRYQARVRAINAAGSASLWVTTPATSLQGKAHPPPQPMGLTTTPMVSGITLNWSFPAGVEDTFTTELEYQTEREYSQTLFSPDSGGKPLTELPYPQRYYTMQGLAAGKVFYFRARLVDRTGNLGAWTAWVRGQSSKDARLLLDQLRDDIMTTEAGKELTDKIDRTELSMNSRFKGFDNALNNYSKKIVLTKQISGYQTRDVQQGVARLDKALNSYKTLMATQFDQAKAETLEIKKTQSQAKQALSLHQTAVTARLSKNEAALETKATTHFNATGGNALYSIKAGITYQGKYYDAGMVVGVETQGGSVKSQIGFNADHFVLLSGQQGKKFSPFAVKNNQVFIREGFIQDGSITNAKIGNTLQSTNYVANTSGWRWSKNGGIEMNGTGKGKARMTIKNNRIDVYDERGVLRVRFGEL